MINYNKYCLVSYGQLYLMLMILVQYQVVVLSASVYHNQCDKLGKVYNPITEQCECSRILDCPENQVFDDARCKCRCQTWLTCSYPRYFDVSSCSCECVNNNKCPGKQTFNSKICQCMCPNHPSSYNLSLIHISEPTRPY